MKALLQLLGMERRLEKHPIPDEILGVPARVKRPNARFNRSYCADRAGILVRYRGNAFSVQQTDCLWYDSNPLTSGAPLLLRQHQELSPGDVLTVLEDELYDLGVGTLPATLPGGVVLLTPEAGLALGVPAGPLLLLLRGGASGYLRAGRQDSRIVPGIQAGAALLVALDRRSALRFDLSRRLYFDRSERTGAFWSVGAGFAILPRGVTIPLGGRADERAPPP